MTARGSAYVAMARPTHQGGGQIGLRRQRLGSAVGPYQRERSWSPAAVGERLVTSELTATRVRPFTVRRHYLALRMDLTQHRCGRRCLGQHRPVFCTRRHSSPFVAR